MLFVVKFLLVFMVIGASGVAKDATREAEFKDHLKWAKENFEAAQKKIAAMQEEEMPLAQGKEQKNAFCASQKCPIKNFQIPVQDEHKTQENPEQKAEKILVFVSFSMPEASLKSLAQEAERANGQLCQPVLIIRGLIEDSFKITAERLKDYALSVEVNPDLFEQYNIQHVPTFVKLKGDQEQAHLSGNVTLKFAMQKLEETS